MWISSHDALNPFPGGRAAFSLLVLPKLTLVLPKLTLVLPKLTAETAKERRGAPLFCRSLTHPRPRISGEHEGSMAANLLKKTAKTAGAVVHCRTRSDGSLRLLMRRASPQDCVVASFLTMTRPFEVIASEAK
jgi:hypothetical protein